MHNTSSAQYLRSLRNDRPVNIIHYSHNRIYSYGGTGLRKMFRPLTITTNLDNNNNFLFLFHRVTKNTNKLCVNLDKQMSQ
jgi:hypothetical protein